MANIKFTEFPSATVVGSMDIIPIVQDGANKKTTASVFQTYIGTLFVNLSGTQTITGSKTFSSQLASSVATGTAPFSVASTTKVTNLNADLLDGLSSAAFQTVLTNPITGTGTTNYLPKFTGASALGNSIISDSAGIATIAGRLTANGIDYHSLTVADGGAQLRLERTGSGAGLMYIGADSIGFKVFDSSFNTRFFVGNTGSVGIGTTSPAEKLSVSGAIMSTGAITGHGANRTTLSQEGSNGAYWQSYGADASTVGTFSLRQASSDFSIVRTPLHITSAGNVGIGTTSPSEELEVYKSQNGITRLLVNNPDTTNANSRAAINVSSGSVLGEMVAITGLGMYFGTASNNFLSFITNGSSRMDLTAGGNLLIGTTTDAGYKLDVNGTARVQGQLTNSQTSATQIQSQIGNSNTQGVAQLQKIVRQYLTVTLGSKLIIPFVSQSNLNGTTFVRIIGHSSSFNSNVPQGFSAEFALGHLTSLSNLSTLNSSGNIASIAINGMNIEITFTLPYTLSTSNGIYTTIEYMTNNVSRSIDVANITMN